MQTAFDIEGNWYKGVTHFHSTGSDGRWTPEEITGWYKEHGYDFCSLTDHLVCTDTKHLSAPTFLTIPGIEMHGRDENMDRTPHVVGLGTGIEGAVDQGSSLQGMIDLFNSLGMLAIVAHPYWSALRDEHLSLVHGYVGIETYNHTCWQGVGKGDSLTYWDNLLYDGRPIWGLAVDDAHCPPGREDIGGGWIVVKAKELTEPDVLEAIRLGRFYASQGPVIEAWQIEGTEVYVRCSPVERIQVHGPNGMGRTVRAPEGERITEASFTFEAMPSYLRATCVDPHHNRAWTNPILSEQE